MVYEVKTIQDMSQLDQGNVARVDVYNWGGDYRPETYGILCYVKDQGFAVRMICKESDPVAVMTEQDTYVIPWIAAWRPSWIAIQIRASGISTLKATRSAPCWSALGCPTSIPGCAWLPTAMPILCPKCSAAMAIGAGSCSFLWI